MSAGYTAGHGGDPGIDHPWYGIGFGAALKRWFQKLFRFDGRASRGEYWWVALVTILINAVVNGVLSANTYATMMSTMQSGATPEVGAGTFFGSLISILIFVLTLGLLVRRLHDANFSGWMALLMLVPCVGGLIVLILTILPSKPEGARFDRVS